ncbi:hypothetical protein G7Y89_g13490 [Cudoniella acicularis]|uniref:Uncharacterized protein n=1 Tax=Cudoniella acicularis TaxID=354080 RepID=A0A8H4VYM5_9HELO|nr:hypothetical protein G7Y89_g13490 [Cudoniella acicularis]
MAPIDAAPLPTGLLAPTEKAPLSFKFVKQRKLDGTIVTVKKPIKVTDAVSPLSSTSITSTEKPTTPTFEVP